MELKIQIGIIITTNHFPTIKMKDTIRTSNNMANSRQLERMRENVHRVKSHTDCL